MEFDGDEKRIQALFSELSFADQSRAPEFGHLWTRAQAIDESGLRLAFARLREKTFISGVVVSSLVIAAVCSLALWKWYGFTPSSNRNISNYVPQQVSEQVRYTPGPVKLQPAKSEPRPQKHIARRRRQVDHSIATEAALLSSWQSPTQQFMRAPTDLALGSLPVLNQSVKDLESFLSKSAEIMKESNR